MNLPETFKHNSNIMFLFFEPTLRYWSYYEYEEIISKYIYYSPDFITVDAWGICEIYLNNYLAPRLSKVSR